MRIAVTGTHGSGKTTLIEDFVAANQRYEHMPEQLSQSCALILAATEPDVIFDRCPLDFIAYLEVVGAAEGFEWAPDGTLLSRIEKALATLDLVVFVPLVRPGEIKVAIEYPKLRARVDARLKSMLRDDDLGLLEQGPRVVEVIGTREERVAVVSSVAAGNRT